MLRLRRGVVVRADPLTVEIDGETRPAWADTGLVGPCRPGDDVIVNVAALDLGLGSGGFDIVHVNLSRGLDADALGGDHVIKLNYTSLQHPIDPLEMQAGEATGEVAAAPPIPVLAIPLHGHLSPALWAAKRRAPEASIGYVQTPGGAIAGRLSQDVTRLSSRGLLAGHVTSGAAHGGQYEAVTLIGGLDAAARALGWDAVIAGPGPGILGSASRFGHGGMAALDAIHCTVAAGLRPVVSPRMSSGDPRPRHRGLSHHTRTVLASCIVPATVAIPSVHAGDDEHEDPLADAAQTADLNTAIADLRELCAEHGHELAEGTAAIPEYRQSGLPARTMGRSLAADEAFFAAALASGDVLGSMLSGAAEGKGAR